MREHFERPNAVIAQNVVIAPAVQLSSGQASERGGTARPLVAPKGSCTSSFVLHVRWALFRSPMRKHAAHCTTRTVMSSMLKRRRAYSEPYSRSRGTSGSRLLVV